jgi:hypothetical protein
MLVRFTKRNYKRAKENVADEDLDALGIGDYLRDQQLYVVVAVYPRLWGVRDRPGFVLKDTARSKPLQYDSLLFNVVDSRLSKWWIYHTKVANNAISNTGEIRSWLAIPTWTVGFHLALVDGLPAAVRAFRKYERLIEWEWPRPDVTEQAQALEDDWVMCPNCTESWEVDRRLALCQCPSCNRMLSNPYWSDPHDLDLG